ncbi:semaphorin-5A, partial [Agrilus planipennis]|uniref:Semaphorin-5A n=1 Tax=Agrilus planipennis TaxID=224129 RepID=A0A1W4XAR5_AGRPL
KQKILVLINSFRDAVFRLSLSGLHLLENVTWPATKEKIRLCLAKGQTEEKCRNYVKVLLSNGKRIFTCGTNAFSPICTWREIDNLSSVMEWTDGIARCPHNPMANTTTLISETGDYYLGGAIDFLGSDSGICKSSGKHIIRTKQYNSLWLNDPQFVGSFESGKFVYFVFKEAAVEYINCGKIIYSRIARVCKNDVGGQSMLKDNWTTFLKARLNCSLNGEYPFYFNEIQGISFVPEENLFYATFTTPINSIAGSAICAFNLTAINEAFSGPFKYQEHAGNAWDRHYSTYRDNFDCSAPTNTKYLMEVSKYQLMDNAVQATTLNPLFVSELERFTHITVDITATKLHSSLHVLYVATTEGFVKKLSVLPNTHETCVVEVWQPVVKENILSIQYLKESDSLYAGTNTGLLKIPSNHCRRHVSRESCLNAMDPYCGWNELEDACTGVPNGGPLVKHWHQSIISCPILNAPVDGGWSSWSAWTPCQLRSSENVESPDTCMCQTRQCNNPAPLNGGSECVGESTAVINCTAHGGWTPWSAWSACSATCGIAVKTRKRTCSNPTPAHGGRVCVGQDRAEVLCAENPPCPVPVSQVRDGQWSEWGDWGPCSVPCGGGFRKRQRRCDNPLPSNGGLDCIGCHLEYETCNMHSCSEQKRHSPWTPWLLANKSTDIGEYVEKRFKFSCQAPVQNHSQIKISLYKEDERVCRDGMCALNSLETMTKWSAWSQWGECSVKCGEGVQTRHRRCRGGHCHGSSVQTKRCFNNSCKDEWGCWTDWSPCSVSCGLGIKKRSRECLGKNCEGETVQEKPCEEPPCSSLLGWDSWTVWSVCDENNEQHRKRKCRTSNPGPHMCKGPEKETRICVPEYSSNEFTVKEAELKTASLGIGGGIIAAYIITGFVVGVLTCFPTIIFYMYLKKKRHKVPSSPHYISAKENPYIPVPLQDLSTRKQHGASSSHSVLNNSHCGTIKSNKLFDFDTATIKRNSHGLNNGHRKSDNFYYD